ncbi:ubiquitin-protein transferase [Aureococcus anophagefferens]|uniref:Ubiquitin-protein transferase n=2 Tax=Aureococcus anophagefferens TaxID=44056 RepID=A0ABR1FYC9_AURAN
MALHRTKGEMIARYTEGWPLDLVPGRTRDLSRPANFDKAFSKRAPYEAGDGIEDWMLVAWGNGGSGRSGTGDLCSYRAAATRSRTAGRRSPFVDVCGSRRHSLFANQEGIVFACGEGADGQLGSKRLPSSSPSAKEKAHRRHDGRERRRAGKMLTSVRAPGQGDDRKKKKKKHAETSSFARWLASGGRRYLRYPVATFPSGVVRGGGDGRLADVHVVEVAASDRCSFAREVAYAEAARARVGLERMVQTVVAYERRPRVGFADAVARLRACLVEECAALRRDSRGRVLSWGRGDRGELGLGDRVTMRAAPTLVPALARRCVTSIAAGKAHVLALCATQGHARSALYAWGAGRDGRLGHDDYAHRFEPTAVAFFQVARLRVRLVAAGDAHSLAVADATEDARERPGVYTWGRGAHGRLGLRRTLNKRRPHLVTEWPPSFRGCRVVGAALGGAHSLVLAEEAVPPGLVNPWGVRRAIYSWGYGANGQLGTDAVVDSPVPRKVKMPKFEVVAQIACGKAHSLALTVHGDLYAWGKGWQGELGHGDARLRVAPKKVDSPHQFVKVAGGDQHTLGVALRHRAVGARAVERRPVGAPNAHVGPARRRAATVATYGYGCVRSAPRRRGSQRSGRPEPPRRAAAPLYCRTCDVLSVCTWCARFCHGGHDVVPVDEAVAIAMPRWGRSTSDAPCSGAYQTLCECGFRDDCCRMPCLSEFLEDPRVPGAAGALHRFARASSSLAAAPPPGGKARGAPNFKGSSLGRFSLVAAEAALAFCRRFAAAETWAGPGLAGAVWGNARAYARRKSEALEARGWPRGR